MQEIPEQTNDSAGSNRYQDAATARHSKRIFTALALIQSTLIFTITMIGVPLPEIGREFGLTAAQLLLLSASYGLPFSGLLLFGGRLADRYGGRRMLLIGLSLFGIASLLAAFAPGYEVLVAMRFTQGVGAALIAPAAMAVLHFLFPTPAAFGRAMASWGGVSVLGSVMGFLIAGPVITWVSWRWMFAVPICVALLGFSVAWCLAQRAPNDAAHQSDKPSLDPIGALLATLGISSTSYGLIATGDYGWSSPMVFLPLGAGLVLLSLFLAVERRVAGPLLPPGFIGHPCRIAGLTGMLLAAAAAGGLISFVLSLYLQQARGWSPLATAGAFFPFAATLIVTGRFAVPLVSRYGASRITIAGLVVAAVGLLLLAGLERETNYVTGLLPGLILLASGGSLLFSGSAVLSTADVPPQQAGLAGGVMNTAMELGPTVGLATLMSVAATRLDAVNGYGWAFGTAGTAFLVAAIALTLLTRQAACSVQTN
ncbi:putative transmembrane efflux protein [Aquitalea magnusonii]|uniref:Putative transmembrane efflux protein n=1 Tax=Aquitalea magnusonii TaxID=332411 RepID=A0A3G9GI70_9NEIS|nr:MFS transporter [Aquitalea magnusonii]BBF87578.1 putative transmembrane efflux protein [Aquitalea magnusonii]